MMNDGMISSDEKYDNILVMKSMTMFLASENIIFSSDVEYDNVLPLWPYNHYHGVTESCWRWCDRRA